MIKEEIIFNSVEEVQSFVNQADRRTWTCPWEAAWWMGNPFWAF